MKETERLPPLAPEAMTEAQRGLAERIAGGPRGGLRGPFIPLLYAPDLAERVQALGEHLRFGGAVPNDLKELAILIGARWSGCEYEWQAHRRLALKAGLDAGKIDAIGLGRRPDDLTQDETLIYDLVIELLATGDLGDEMFARGKKAFGEPGLIELVTLPGYYFMLALVLNVARTRRPDLEEGPFPPNEEFPRRF